MDVLDRAAQATRRIAEPERPTWETALEQLEDPMIPWREDDGLALQLVIAQQLRELLHAIRPLLKHPLLRRT